VIASAIVAMMSSFDPIFLGRLIPLHPGTPLAVAERGGLVV
jgi:hypothetical protein